LFQLNADGWYLDLETGDKDWHNERSPYSSKIHLPAIVEAILDWTKGTLSFLVNGYSLGTAFAEKDLCEDSLW